MKAVRLLLIVILVPVFFTSCQKIKGKGDVISETRTVTGYSKIDLSMDATVSVTNGDTNSIEILAQENLMPYIQTKLENNRLVIRVKTGYILGNHDPIQIRVTAAGVEALSVSGSGDLNMQNEWQGSSLEVGISGSGNISLSTVTCTELKATISGSGNIEAAGGLVTTEDLTISGSGNIDVRQIISWDTDANISGSGSIYTQVNHILDGTISGSGNIYYLGIPVVNAHISGSGSIIHL